MNFLEFLKLSFMLNFNFIYLYLRYMGSKLIVIYFRYMVSRWICMYLVYNDSLTRLSLISLVFLPLSPLAFSLTSLITYLYFKISMYLMYMYLVWITCFWDTLTLLFASLLSKIASLLFLPPFSLYVCTSVWIW